MWTETEIYEHKEWLGYLQPVGLVVVPVALVHLQAIVSRNTSALQAILLAELTSESDDVYEKHRPYIKDLRSFVQKVLGWNSEDLICVEDNPELLASLEVNLPDYGEVLYPTYVVPDVPDSDDEANAKPWQMLIVVCDVGRDLDQDYARSAKAWKASPQARMERLLRELGYDIGLLVNGTDVRLVYAPQGESSGYITFPMDAMCEVQGRLILGAFRMLLEADRLFEMMPRHKRLTALLKESRLYQNEVSTKLSDQVLHALIGLLQGFQSANGAAKGKLLETATKQQREHIYGGLLTTLMRLVFLLYTEDRGLMPEDDLYLKNYSISGLFEQLREDLSRYPDMMDYRYGAWPRLLTLFRLVYDGATHESMQLPQRHGELFDPDAYPFLEGRPSGVKRVIGDIIDPPLISDGVIYRILENLLIVDGESLSYRALDVEQIGSVYEAMMGFAVEVAEGRSMAVKPHHVTVNFEQLLAAKPPDRASLLLKLAQCKVSGKALDALKNAHTPEDVACALQNHLSPHTPHILSVGSLFLQPGEDRRKTGSHYTPRVLTKPIVESALRPVLGALGANPTPQQILDLKICDPAMGSGAFLVEACRQLAEKLVAAWSFHGGMPDIQPDAHAMSDLRSGDTPLLCAYRVVAQRCIYGVDKNPFAVYLAKLSIWLVTLSRHMPFTFLDHALKCGDSLVGLSHEQIACFHLQTAHAQLSFAEYLHQQVLSAIDNRQQIQSLDEDDEPEKRAQWLEAENKLDDARLLGDLLIYSFFSHDKDKERAAARDSMLNDINQWHSGKIYIAKLKSYINDMRTRDIPILPFHWQIEFPEVFLRSNGGFDAIVGNPPFAGKNTTISGNAAAYLDWLKVLHEGSHGNSDLAAHFFRRSFNVLRNRRTMGLIATNTIAQGDTRNTGLRWICQHGGEIYEAQRRYRWPGIATVIVSTIHIHKGPYNAPRYLDGREVSKITAFLFHAGGDDNPVTLRANAGISYIGSYILGMGFTFDDTDSKGIASPLAEMHRLIAKDPRNAERIFPYIGGEEVNTSPTHSPHRYVINFGQMTEAEARTWPDLMQIVEDKVKPERMKNNREGYRRYWWQFGEKRIELFRAIAGMERVLAGPRVTKHLSFAWLPTDYVFADSLVMFAFDRWQLFTMLQSRIHEIWVRFFSSSLGDGLRYAPSDCFETFPLPSGWKDNAELEAIGEEYYRFRADLMMRNDEGLTQTYNRFHDRDEIDPKIDQLRKLHDDIDRAVLAAYGWQDLNPQCEFILEYDDQNDDASKRKKPWRYRWTEEAHDEVLARLLALNQQQADMEAVTTHTTKQTKTNTKPKRKTNDANLTMLIPKDHDSDK